ncbi:MAG TPA: VOC family protein [Solirubrobacterales bacterium]|nr:VOC family protein [Solirubrobacterales bacterium]
MARATLHPVVHLELHTQNAARACGFYARLFGWRTERVKTGGHEDYLVLMLADVIEGGVVEGETGRPHWLPYVAVADIEDATERARILGAEVVVEPSEGPAGWRSVVTSAAGADVALWQPKTTHGP